VAVHSTFLVVMHFIFGGDAFHFLVAMLSIFGGE